MSPELPAITWPANPPPPELTTLAWGQDESTIGRALLNVRWRVFGRDVSTVELGFVEERLHSVRLYFAGLLPGAAELARAGFSRSDEGYWTRQSDTTTTEVDLLDGHVTLSETL